MLKMIEELQDSERKKGGGSCSSPAVSDDRR